VQSTHRHADRHIELTGLSRRSCRVVDSSWPIRFPHHDPLGIGLAGVFQTFLVAFGLGNLIEVWPVVATAIRFAGAMSLAFLGISLLKYWWLRKEIVGLARTLATLEGSTKTMFMAGFAINLLSPKALLFISVFVPQIVNPSLGSPLPQIAALGLLVTLIALFYSLTIAFVFAQFKRIQFSRGATGRNG
jgi:threonine/homoserine/homoserine lactone efflux protein